ncbi:asparagine synthase (glutamine-hydrolyzing) [Candidatus Woesearchaeota archaeon]|nr:asparagine synthase (glutamine-hydrolyzing) [Candidatus Woesearchaeota archaeon]
MCGICGFYGFEDKALLRQMSKSIKHRGPDSNGEFFDKKISLGHRRLSIIDLSDKGKQPMSNEDESIHIVFNGEIYNYKELKDDLESKGHKFKSNTDTEVIIHAYEEYGNNYYKKFNGCFAYALWDSNKQTLQLVRDRLGIKPLYYCIFNGALYFASEIKSILQDNRIPREVNFTALHDYLSFRNNALPETMFKGIFKLMPGHTLTLSHNSIRVNKYWDLTYNPLQGTEKYFASKLLNLMTESVKKRLMSDVPLGVYLSGGIDSATIVGLMKSFHNDEINTFSVGFNAGENVDELSHAQIIANHFNTKHKEILVEADAAKLLPIVTYNHDEPVADPTSIPTYLLSKDAKKHVTVILSGDGSDELFGGYTQYKLMRMRNQYIKYMPLSLRKLAPYIAKNTPPNLLNKLFKYSEALGSEGIKRMGNYVTSSIHAKQYLELISIFDEEEKRGLYSKNIKKETNRLNLNTRLENLFFKNYNDLLNNLLYLETKIILTDGYLMKVDKNTMANGIEGRVPFLDHNVAEFASKVPVNFKLKGFTEKYILRKSMKNILPEHTLKRKKDRFFVPIDSWLQGDLKSILEDKLSKNLLKKQGIFNYSYVKKALNNFNNSKLFYSRQLWCLLTFQYWYEMFIENEKI